MTFSFALGDPGDETKGTLGMGLSFLGGDRREPVLEPAEPAAVEARDSAAIRAAPESRPSRPETGTDSLSGAVPPGWRGGRGRTPGTTLRA